MEAAKTLNAEEERRRKLQEYLTAKGKLKPQNHNRPYLKDSTNLQAKGRQQPAKQVSEKKDVPLKGTRYGSEANKNRISTTGPLQNRRKTQPNVLSKKVDHKALARNPTSSKENLQRMRPVLPAQAVQSKNVNPKDKLLGKKSSSTVPLKARTEAEIGLTVVLTKNQHGDETRISDVHLVNKPFVSKRPSEIGDIKITQTKDPGRQTLPQPSVGVSVKKSQAQPSKPPPVCQETNARQPTGKAMPPTSVGHIRIVSRVSQPLPNIGTPSERSFLIKSSRKVQPQRPLTMQVKSAAPEPSCATKPNAAVKSTSSSTIGQKKVCPHPVSTTRTVQCSSAHTSNKALPIQSRHSISKPAVWQKDRTMTACTAPGPQTGSTNCTKGTGSKPAVTIATNQPSSSSSLPCMTANDAVGKPQTPKMSVEDRRKKLQEWLNSKGKTYKRPPLTLPPKRPPTAKKKQNPNSSVWEGIEEEEELLLLSQKISQTLGECLELIDKGVSSEDIHGALDKIPEGKKFAKYWVCKAKLLEREGVSDVMELYKQGVQCAATPIDELREAVFDIMKKANKKAKVVTFGPLPNEDTAEGSDHYNVTDVHGTPVMKTPCLEVGVCEQQGSAVKFQISCISSNKKKKGGSRQEWKCLTPVRRSLRIHQAASQHPQVIQEHDNVKASLKEVMDMSDTEAYLYVRNEALPEDADHLILSMAKQNSSGGSE